MTITRLLKRLSCLLLCVTFTQLAFSQTKTVTGTVTDDKGAPVQGASVIVSGSSSGTTTAADGTFKLSVSESASSLTISSVGFTTQTVDITGKTEVAVSLVSSNSSLNEVVVVGYGTVRKRDLTGSAVSVKAKDFNKGVVASPDQLLQNKVAGLEITANSGQPGAATTIKIRGNNSIRTNNNPLYVIDGVPLDGRTAKPNLVFSGLDFGTTPESNPLLYINPNDIAQIDVLKDASATAIYGSRGANGIIVITTKKGSSGPPKLEFNANWGINAGYMKKYKILTASQFRSFTQKNSLSFDSGATVDPLKSISQSGFSQNYNLAVSGGNDNGKYRISFLGSNTDGLIKKTGLDKYLANIAGQYKFLDKRLSIDFNVIAGHTTESMGVISNTAGANGNLMSYALNWNPTKSFTAGNGLWSTGGIPNPLALIDAYSDVANVEAFLANLSAGLKLAKGLEYKFLYAVNHGKGKRLTNMDGWIDNVKGVSGSGFAEVSDAELTSQTFTHTLNYNTNFSDDLSFDAVAGYEYWKTDYSTSFEAASQFNFNLDPANRVSIPYTSIFQNAGIIVAPLSTIVDPTTEIQSYFARVNFNLREKYYLTATFRADGSNKFGKNNKYGYFPSVGAKWVVSNETFLKGSNVLSNLATRGSWGITGNQEFPSGAALEQFNSNAYNNFGQVNVANPDLKWEKTTSVDVGLDFALLNNKITGSFDYYHKNTTDLLFQGTAIQPAPSSIFFKNLPANLINSGVEFAASSTIIDNKSFSWDFGFNIAYNKNKLTNFNEAPIPTASVSGQGVSGAFAQIITNNQPVDEFYLKKFKGYDQAGQQIIEDTASFCGDPNPHILLGISTTLRLNKFSLTLNAGGAYDYLIYNNTHNSVTNIGVITKGQNIDAEALNSQESVNDGVAVSSRYLESGNYLKLRNATISYDFGNIGSFFKNCSAYISGTNLFVITKFTGFDPEVNIDKNNNNYPSRNMEYIPYPTPRMVTFGINFGL
jgi:iron complex outermembrane receptor protein